MEIGLDTWQRASWIAVGVFHSCEHLGSDISACACDFGRIQLGYDKRVDIYYHTASRFRVYQDIVVREIGMCKSRSVHPSYRTRKGYAYLQHQHEIAELARVEIFPVP